MFYRSAKNRFGKGFQPLAAETQYRQGFTGARVTGRSIQILYLSAKNLIPRGFQPFITKKIFYKKNFVAIKNRLYLSHLKIQKKLS